MIKTLEYLEGKKITQYDYDLKTNEIYLTLSNGEVMVFTYNLLDNEEVSMDIDLDGLESLLNQEIQFTDHYYDINEEEQGSVTSEQFTLSDASNEAMFSFDIIYRNYETRNVDISVEI